MKKIWLYVFLGFILGLTAAFGIRQIGRYLARKDHGSIVLCRNGVNLSARWGKNLLDLSYYYEGEKNRDIPSEVVFHDTLRECFWIIDNIFFIDFNRDGIADAKVETFGKKQMFIRRGDQWSKCFKVSISDHSAIDLQGKTLTFNDVWL